MGNNLNRSKVINIFVWMTHEIIDGNIFHFVISDLLLIDWFKNPSDCSTLRLYTVSILPVLHHPSATPSAHLNYDGLCRTAKQEAYSRLIRIQTDLEATVNMLIFLTEFSILQSFVNYVYFFFIGQTHLN